MREPVPRLAQRVGRPPPRARSSSSRRPACFGQVPGERVIVVVHRAAVSSGLVGVVTILGRGQALGDQGLGGVGAAVQQQRQFLAFGGGEVAQHVERRASIRPGGLPMPNLAR